MKVRHLILLVLAEILLASGTLAVARHAHATDRCLFGSCASGSTERLFGPGPGAVDVTKRGYGSWNDDYNQHNQERYRAGTKAEPFDFDSSARRTRSLNKTQKPSFNDNRPDARDEHVRWCFKRYRSYAVATNTYVTYEGRTRYCSSPFN